MALPQIPGLHATISHGTVSAARVNHATVSHGTGSPGTGGDGTGGPDTGDTPLRGTISIGVATLGSSRRDLEELLAAADHALCQAKETGRNRVCLLTASPADPAGSAVSW